MADIKLDWSSDDRQVQKAFDRQQRELDKLKAKLGQVAKTSKQGSQQAVSGFSAAASSVARYAAGFVGIQSAIRLTTRLFSAMEAARKKAFEEGKAAEPNLAELLQLTDTPAQARRILGKAKRFRQAGAGASLADAALTVFELESAGLGGEEDFFKELGRGIEAK